MKFYKERVLMRESFQMRNFSKEEVLSPKNSTAKEFY